MKQMRFKPLGIASALAGVGGSLITLVLALNDFGVWALVLGGLGLAGIKTLSLNLSAGRPVGFSLRISHLRSYLPFSANLIAQRIVWFYVEQIDRLIIGKALGAAPLGSYSVARQLSHMPLDRTAEIVNQVTLPSFSAVQSEKERWHSALQKLVRLASAVSYPLFFGMAAVAPVALPLLLGERWQGAVWPFVLFCLALPLRTAHSLLATVLFALGRADVSLKIVLIWALVLSPLFVLGVFFGVTGVAAAWAVGFPLVYLLGVRAVAQSLSIPTEGLWAPMFAPALSATGCVAVVFLVYALCDGRFPPTVTLALEISAGALTYVLLLRALSRSAFHEIIDLVRRFTRREQPA
jgi:O-antigen/teichoic acid export membrane protein